MDTARGQRLLRDGPHELVQCLGFAAPPLADLTIQVVAGSTTPGLLSFYALARLVPTEDGNPLMPVWLPPYIIRYFRLKLPFVNTRSYELIIDTWGYSTPWKPKNMSEMEDKVDNMSDFSKSDLKVIERFFKGFGRTARAFLAFECGKEAPTEEFLQWRLGIQQKLVAEIKAEYDKDERDRKKMQNHVASKEAGFQEVAVQLNGQKRRRSKERVLLFGGAMSFPEKETVRRRYDVWKKYNLKGVSTVKAFGPHLLICEDEGAARCAVQCILKEVAKGARHGARLSGLPAPEVRNRRLQRERSMVFQQLISALRRHHSWMCCSDQLEEMLQC